MDVLTIAGLIIAFFMLYMLISRRRFDVQAVIYFPDGRVVVARRTAILHDGLELYIAGTTAVLAYVRTPPIVVRSFPTGLGLRLLFAEMVNPHSAVASDMTMTEARTAAYLSLICGGETRECIKQLVDKISKRTADKLNVALLADDVALAVDVSPSTVVDVLKSLLLHISMAFRDAANVAEKIHQDYKAAASLIRALSRGGGFRQILILLIIGLAALFLLPMILPTIQHLLPAAPKP